MRKALLGTVVGGLLASVSTVHAIDPTQRLPSAQAFFETRFGGTPEMAQQRAYTYGLKIDHDRRFADVPPSALFRVDFNQRGFQSAAFNGLPFAYQVRELNQAGEELNYTVFDYGLAAIGALGVGYAIYKVADAPKETRDPAPEDPGNGGDGGLLADLIDLLEGIPGIGDIIGPLDDLLLGDIIAILDGLTDPVVSEILDVVCVLPLPALCLASGTGSTLMSPVERELRVDPAYIRWLDGGTGQMGDLH